MATDWTLAEARKYAAICRRHGLRCRVVRCRNTDSYVAVYHDASDTEFAAKRAAVRAEALAAGWSGFELLTRVG